MSANFSGVALRRAMLPLVFFLSIMTSGFAGAHDGIIHTDFKITRHTLGANTLDIPDRFYFGFYDEPYELIVRMGWRNGDLLPITENKYGVFVQIYISQKDQEDPKGEFYIESPHKLVELERKDFGKMKYVGTSSAGNYDLFYLPATDSYVGCLRVDAPPGVSIGPSGSEGAYFSCDTVFRYKGNVFAWVKASYIMSSDVAAALIDVHNELSSYIH